MLKLEFYQHNKNLLLVGTNNLVIKNFCFTAISNNTGFYSMSYSKIVKMRKFFILLILCSAFSLVGTAQEETVLKSKNGNIILPEKGDFAIGLDANTILNIIRTPFNYYFYDNIPYSLYAQRLSNTIYAKYFIASNKAVRIKLSIATASSKINHPVINDLNNNETVNDIRNEKNKAGSFIFGYERREGSNRLQISYGVELNLSIESSNINYSYGNQYSESNYYPTTTNGFGVGSNMTERAYKRQIDYNNETLSGGIRLFLGLEYFIMPKVSVGGEVGLKYANTFSQLNSTVYETWDFINNQARNDYQKGDGVSSSLSSDNLNGQFFILFHF